MKLVETTLAAAVADDGTFTVAYPAGTNQAFFIAGNASATGQMVVNNNDVWEEADPGISISYDASEVTITNLTGAALAAGSELKIGLAYADEVYSFGGQKSAAIASLTDSSGGTAADTIAAIGATYDQAEVRNAVASLAAKVNRLILACEKAGIIEE